MKFKSKLFAAFLFAGLTAAALAAETTTGNSSAEKEIATKLHARYPSTQISDVHATAIDGIYEVVMGKNIGYTNSEGRYFMFGHIFDMTTQQDVTQQRIDALNVVNFSQLPLKDAIKTVRGKGQRMLAIFSDPDCPYCKKLANELPKLDNVTIYTFLMPLDGLHPEASKKAKAIWCSTNKSQALENYMLHDKTPDMNKTCDNPIDRNVQLGQKLNINGTPTLISADGRVLPGMAAADQLEKFIAKEQK